MSVGGYNFDDFGDDDDIFGEIEKEEQTRNKTPLKAPVKEQPPKIEKTDSFFKGMESKESKGYSPFSGTGGGSRSKAKDDDDEDDDFQALLDNIIEKVSKCDDKKPGEKPKPATAQSGGYKPSVSSKPSSNKETINRKRALFGLPKDEEGDIFDQEEAIERPFTSPGMGVEQGAGSTVPSWLNKNVNENKEMNSKTRPATTGTGANKPPLYAQKSGRFEDDDLNDRDVFQEEGYHRKKELQVTPPIGLNYRADDDILSNQEITTFGRRPRTDENQGMVGLGSLSGRNIRTAGAGRQNPTLLQNKAYLQESPQEALTEKRVDRLRGAQDQLGGGYKPADMGSHQGSYYGQNRGGGDILDFEVNSQAGPAGALSGRSSNVGIGNQSPTSKMQQPPSGQRINTTFSQNQGPSSLLSPPIDRVMSGTDSQKNKSVLLTEQGPTAQTKQSKESKPVKKDPVMDNSEVIAARKEKDSLKEQLEQQKRHYADLIDRMKSDLAGREQRVDLLEEQNKKMIEDLRERHQKDIEILEEQHKKAVQQLLAQKNELQREMDRNVIFERERLQALHQAELLNLDKNQELSLSKQEKINKQQIESMQRQLDQQIASNKFLQEVRDSSSTLEQNMQALNEQREAQLRERTIAVSERERIIETQQRDKDLKKKNLELERQSLGRREGQIKMREDGLVKRSQIQQTELHQKLVEIEHKRSDTLSQIQKMYDEIQLKQNELQTKKNNIVTAKSSLELDYKQKFDQIAFQRKIFQSDKVQYQLVCQSQQQSYQSKLVEIEDKKTELAELEQELKRRDQLLNERESQLAKEESALKVQHDKLLQERRDIDEKAQEVTNASLKVHEESEIIFNFKNSIDSQRQDIEQSRFQLEAERAYTKAEKLRLQELRTELTARQKAFEGMRFQYVQDVGEGKYGAVGLMNPRVGMLLEQEIPTVVQKPVQRKVKPRFESPPTLSRRSIFKADQFMNDLELKIKSGSGGTGDPEHLRFLQQEQTYILEAKSKHEQRMNNLASSLRWGNSAGSELS